MKTIDSEEATPNLKRKQYEKELRKLQTDLCRLQEWVKLKGLKVIVVFEGRDAAGKGGTIKAITERVSPRVFRLVALPAPSDREKTQTYLQRYMQHFPAAGEVVIFDRSWYNRAGVERVMGFCSEKEYKRFLKNCPVVEQYIVDGGIILVKFWLEVGKKEQQRRFEARIDDPLRQWKLSPMDVESWTLSLAKTPSALPHNDLRHLAESVPYTRITDSKDQGRSEAGDSVAGAERLRCQPFAHADTCQQDC